LATFLPESSEIISEFHFCASTVKTEYGGYVDCQDKSVAQIQSDYYAEIYEMIVASIEAQSNLLSGVEARIQEEAELGGLDPSAEPDPDAPSILDSYKMERESIVADLEHMRQQKESMDAGLFAVSGVRLRAKNAEIAAIAGLPQVLAVENLHYDNNSVITPIILA
jgi:hypothetical protein